MDLKVIDCLIKNHETYYAHIKRNAKDGMIKKESLAEHTALTVKYFQMLWKEKYAEELLERFCLRVWKTIKPETKEFLKEMILGIPMFHDFGKINPEFQRKLKKDFKPAEMSIFFPVGSRHSIISAVMYLDYFLERLKTEITEKEEKQKLRPFILYHSYIIERHHSNLNEFQEYLESLETGSGAEVIRILAEGSCKDYQKICSLKTANIHSLRKAVSEMGKEQNSETGIAIYGYVKLLYSFLTVSDYYATSEFMSGVLMMRHGELTEIDRWTDVYENTVLMRKIRSYQKKQYPAPEEVLKQETDINVLRTEMLLDAEKVFIKEKENNIFYLEAPTGSGKSNNAMNLSFQMLKTDKKLKKIYYIYPFNTLVEQNLQSLNKIFEGKEEILNHIAVVNSLTPIKLTEKERAAEEEIYYQKALLDRQFLNYPMILSTHISLFDTMFGDSKESAFGFHQLLNSVVVLDEIQSYKNTIWSEIIHFLKEFSQLFHMKIIVMSATLPNLDLLTGDLVPAVNLLQNKEKYFLHSCFKNRVQISYYLLEQPISIEILLEEVKIAASKGKKVLAEFIKKKTAAYFFEELKKDSELSMEVEYLSGDDSLAERKRILKKIEDCSEGMILIATQVVEAGVDIDMDIGFKNISKLDSEEQFLGRINRSCKREGMSCFFQLDDARSIYKDDIRQAKEFTLETMQMRKILSEKDFAYYYREILKILKKNYNEQIGEYNIKEFFEEKVCGLCFPSVKKRMELIQEDQWNMSVFLAVKLTDDSGNCIDGAEIWKRYTELLEDCNLGFAEKTIKLSQVKSQMNDFIYQIQKNPNLHYNDRIGDLFFIEDGEKYFQNGKLNRRKIQGELEEFVDFI